MIGRLTLTWAHKGESLVSDGIGGYEWVSPRDPKAAEIRLMKEVTRVGDVTGTAADNLLVAGDGLHLLNALVRDPEYADEYRGKVKLVYIDPPFNTGQAFDHYDDGVEHSVWLGLMQERLELIRDLLAPDGSVWVHLDDAEVHYAKVLMDEVFGRTSYVATVAWRSADTGNYDDAKFSGDYNSILIYGARPGWRANGLPRNKKQSSHYKNPDNDPRGPWFDGNPLGSPNPRDNLMYDVVSPQGHVIKHPPHGWRWQRSTMERMIDEGSIRFNGSGTRIVYRTYLREQGTLPPSNLWADVDETGSNRKAKNELKSLFGLPAKQVFSTPKPERLLHRVLLVATQPGDTVVDVFGGSATTAAVAHKMGRRWVTAEREQATVDTFIRPRLTKIVEGTDDGGITDEVNWAGGGGFRELAIAEPVYRSIDLGGVNALVIEDDVDDAALARSVAAQLGFTYEPGENGIAGSNGRARLAVVRGHADSATVEVLLAAIEENELLTLAATTATEDVRAVLRDARPGSRLVMIPNGLFPTSAVTR